MNVQVESLIDSLITKLRTELRKQFKAEGSSDPLQRILNKTKVLESHDTESCLNKLSIEYSDRLKDMCLTEDEKKTCDHVFNERINDTLQKAINESLT